MTLANDMMKKNSFSDGRINIQLRSQKPVGEIRARISFRHFSRDTRK